ncbi:MAG: hypothetical protein Q7S53_05015 [bacterium]|nr:hypothetical protein [bacterium]
MKELGENTSERKNQWLTDEENDNLDRLNNIPNPTHKELEGKTRLLLLADLRKRKSEGKEFEDETEERIINGLKRTFAPDITDNDINREI